MDNYTTPLTALAVKEALLKASATKESALQFLVDAGIIDAKPRIDSKAIQSKKSK